LCPRVIYERYFFFQAEDGIRDRNVTGVQTCALPMSTKPCILITSMHKTFKTFLFFTRKKKQKNLTSATSAKGGFALVARLKKTRDRSYFSKRCAEKSPP